MVLFHVPDRCKLDRPLVTSLIFPHLIVFDWTQLHPPRTQDANGAHLDKAAGR
jgi:hypothetical protein